MDYFQSDTPLPFTWVFHRSFIFSSGMGYNFGMKDCTFVYFKSSVCGAIRMGLFK